MRESIYPRTDSDYLTTVAPARSVDNNTTDAARNNTSNRKGNHPAHVDPGNHAPVNRAPSAGTETDTDGGTSDTLGSRYGKF